MTRKKMSYVAIAVVLAVGGSLAWTLTARGAYESAEYQVTLAEGKFEIREYPDLMLASTEMRTASQGNDGSFMRLFRYISGKNEAEQKVAMTTPVFMEQSQAEPSKGRMGFVIPKDVAAGGAPTPASSDVQLRKRTGGRFAVIQFSGRMDDKSLADAEQKLRQWMATKSLTGASDMESAGYDPPWTPGLWRRNEVLIRLTTQELPSETSTTVPVAEEG